MSDNNSTPGSGQAGLAEQLNRLRAHPQIPLILAVAAAAAILVGIFLWSSSPNYGVLFSGLSNKAGGKIIAELENMNVPYKLGAGGATILVPESNVSRVRLELASNGLPKAGGVSFEIMDNQPLGISKFAEHVNYQRALQGELERSIETINAVQSVQVNLTMPESSVFVRQRKHAKAAVVISLYAGRALSQGQVIAIQHLVASSVSRMPVDAVTVINSRGDLLSRRSLLGQGADARKLAYTTRVNAIYREKVRQLLKPVLGPDNFRVQVNAALDFSIHEMTQQTYAPNNEDHGAAIRSQQREYNASGNKQAVGGIPGALSNQPSPPQPSPINDPEAMNNNGDGLNDGLNGEQNGGQNQNATDNDNTSNSNVSQSQSSSNHGSMSSSTITNYELGHTVEHIKKPLGRLENLSVAVVINAVRPESTTPESATNTARNKLATPASNDSGAIYSATSASTDGPLELSDAELAEIKTLVRSAIGFSQAHGDQVTIVRSSFNGIDHTTSPAQPWWQRSRVQALAETLFTYLIIAIVAFLLWRKIIKPLVDNAARQQRTARAPSAPRAPSAAEPGADDDVDDETEAARRARDRRNKQRNQTLSNVKEVARDDPRMVAMIIKNWMKNRG